MEKISFQSQSLLQQLGLFVVSVGIGIGIVFFYAVLVPPFQKKTMASPLPHSFFSFENAPSTSLKGTIATFSGEVKWESRTATQPATLTRVRSIQQGEEVYTGDDGTMTLHFPSVLSISLKPQTSLALVQTLPDNFVLTQNSGSATYEQQKMTSLSIRSHHLLIEQNEGTMSITTNPDTTDVLLTVERGSATVAYNDNESVSKVLSIPEGKQFIFHDDGRQGFIKTATQ